MKEGTLIFIRNLQVVLEVGGGWALGLCIGKGWVGGGGGKFDLGEDLINDKGMKKSYMKNMPETV